MSHHYLAHFSSCHVQDKKLRQHDINRMHYKSVKFILCNLYIVTPHTNKTNIFSSSGDSMFPNIVYKQVVSKSPLTCLLVIMHNVILNVEQE